MHGLTTTTSCKITFEGTVFPHSLSPMHHAPCGQDIKDAILRTTKAMTTDMLWVDFHSVKSTCEYTSQVLICRIWVQDSACHADGITLHSYTTTS